MVGDGVIWTMTNGRTMKAAHISPQTKPWPPDMPDIHDRPKRDRRFKAWVWRGVAVMVVLWGGFLIWVAIKVFG